MLNIYLTKIKMYALIALLLVIISLIVAIGIQVLRVQGLKDNIEKLEIENQILSKDKKFFEARIKIFSDFTNSSREIEIMTNIVIFDSGKQNVIDTIIDDFNKPYLNAK